MRAAGLARGHRLLTAPHCGLSASLPGQRVTCVAITDTWMDQNVRPRRCGLLVVDLVHTVHPLLKTLSGHFSTRALHQDNIQADGGQSRSGDQPSGESKRAVEGPSISAHVGDSSHSYARSTQFTYHSDGHYKATIEDVFRLDSGGEPISGGKAPWKMGWQTNERNIVWNNDLKMRLLTVRNC
jgi:hypothetical protein